MSSGALTDRSLPLIQFVARPGIIDLAWGHPDPDLLSVDRLQAATARVFDRYGADALNYGYAAGPGPLISWLCQRLGEVDGRAPRSDEVFITGGASQALDHVATLFSRPGDVVLAESPTYHLAVRILRDHPLELVGVPIDEGGIRIDMLKQTVQDITRSGRRIALLYTVPTFHNPTGLTMPADRRQELVAVAASEGFTIVEDDAYRELCYDGAPPPSLWSLAPSGTVIRLGTFAKSLAPGLRSGFITASHETIDRIADSGLIDSGGGISHFSSLVIAEFAACGDYARNVERLRAAYRARRDALLASLGENPNASFRWTRPAGGYFVWLELASSASVTELIGAAERAGVGCMPGSVFYLDAADSRTIRLSFSRYSPDVLVEAGRRLAGVMSTSP